MADAMMPVREPAPRPVTGPWGLVGGESYPGRRSPRVVAGHRSVEPDGPGRAHALAADPFPASPGWELAHEHAEE